MLRHTLTLSVLCPLVATDDDANPEAWNAWARTVCGLTGAQKHRASPDELREAIALRLEKLAAIEKLAASK